MMGLWHSRCFLSGTALLSCVLHSPVPRLGYAIWLLFTCHSLAIPRSKVCHYSCQLCLCFLVEVVGFQSTPAHSPEPSPEATPPKLGMPSAPPRSPMSSSGDGDQLSEQSTTMPSLLLSPGRSSMGTWYTGVSSMPMSSHSEPSTCSCMGRPGQKP